MFQSERWVRVRIVSTTSHGSACRVVHPHLVGTRGVVFDDVMPESDVVAEMVKVGDLHRALPTQSAMGASSYRWTWESRLPSGHRISDMVIVSWIG